MPDMPSSVEVRIENLSLAFDKTEVLKGVDLTIQPGEFFAFLGPSGSGKSTLLRAIAGFGPKPGGRILVDGEDVTDIPAHRRNVGMVFQSYALWPHMTVRKNVAYGLEERNVPRIEIRDRVDEALETVGLLDLAERRPSQLSGGQQQRVALARTIVIRPRVLLLDEPLSNLDANLRIQMRREILELQRELGITTVFVTHDQEEANTMADRMAVLDQGILQQVGAPMELYDDPANLFVATFLGTANVLSGRTEALDGHPVFVSAKGLSLPVDQPNENARHLVIRPQNIKIESQSASTKEGDIQLTGTIKHREFLGSIIRYVIDVNGESLMIDDPHRQGHAVYQDNDAITLNLKKNHLILLNE